MAGLRLSPAECARWGAELAAAAGPAGYGRLLWVLTTAGCPYWVAQSAWSRAAVALARRQVLNAVMRSTFQVAAEAFGCLAAPRRDDAVGWAVVAPSTARSAGWAPERLVPLLGGGRAVGPAAAAHAALAPASVMVEQGHHARRGPVGGVQRRLVTLPWVQRFAAWRRVEWTRLAMRRAGRGPRSGRQATGVGAVRRLADQVAALRAVVLGGGGVSPVVR